PFIYAPPVSRAVISNTVVTLNVLADGTGPLRYQWFQNGFALANGVAASLKIPAFGRADEGLYSVRVTDDVGSTTTDPVKLEILFRPALLSFPSETIAVEGDDVFLFARGAGTRPLTFLWRRGAVLLLTDISTSGSSTLLLRNVKTNQTGNYTVSINNVSGMNIASPAFAIRVLADSDGDHMPNEWELANGLNPKNPADASSDIDGDGYTALQEYWTGSDPRNASSPLRWESTQAISNQIALGFTAVSNRSYSVFARDRVDGIWTKLTDIQARPATQTQTVLDALPITGARYYKLTTPAQP
ncbi:MAG: immunoglobulin domain-containing protein, partial [Verrucomicrobia bacterium]|nr:immunoglobulin domain-containing protein [Verrucomicrobiota bacterium]